MIDLQSAKRTVREFHEALDAAPAGGSAEVIAAHAVPDYLWKGVHPWGTLHGAAAVGGVWDEVKSAMGPLCRRPDIFMAGANVLEDDGGVWVVEMGHLAGNWRAPFLGIPPSGRLAFLRYCEFHRVTGGRIAETASYLEILGLIQQAGRDPLPVQTGAQILTPGPRTHDGLLHDAQDAAVSSRTMEAIHAMVRDLVSSGVSTSRAHLEAFWVEDMFWFGPAGIGASHGFDGYRRGHTGPFEAGLEFIRADGHQVEFAEGTYGGFFGYPSITMRNAGGYLGMPESGAEGEMRLVDLYRCDGDTLAENWIFIDLPHFLHCQGIDVLSHARAGTKVPTRVTGQA